MKNPAFNSLVWGSLRLIPIAPQDATLRTHIIYLYYTEVNSGNRELITTIQVHEKNARPEEGLNLKSVHLYPRNVTLVHHQV